MFFFKTYKVRRMLLLMRGIQADMTLLTEWYNGKHQGLQQLHMDEGVDGSSDLA
jgi:hypothetical protein